MSNKPLYKKIYQDLKKDILTGVYAEESQIPTELELANIYQVSRITSKRALVELESENLIYRVRGKGSFVKKREVGMGGKDSNNNNILFIMPFDQNEGFGNYAEGILESLNDTEYRLQMQPHDWLFTEKALNLKEDYAGIVYYPVNTQESIDFLYQCQLQKIPVVLLDKSIEKIAYDSVVADNESGGFLSAEHLVEVGCDKVYFVSSQRLTDVSSVRDRYLGYLSALYGQGKEPHHLLKDDRDSREVFFEKVYEEIISGTSKKSGLVVENDVLAIRLMTYLKQKGLKIGEELCVVGFDNIQATRLIDPPLSTIGQDFFKMGVRATEILINRITFPSSSVKEYVIPVDLIKRYSSLGF